MVNVAYPNNNIVITGTVGVDVQADTTSAVITSNESPLTFSEIETGNKLPYKFYSHSSAENTFFQAVVEKVQNVEIVTFVEL